jgi:hypothetical protein
VATGEPVANEAEPQDAASVLRFVAGFGLPGGSGAGNDEPLPDQVWSSVVGDARYQRLAGLLMAAIEAGALRVTDDQRAEAQELHLGACGVVLRLERRLVEVARLLNTAGIDLVVLKGTAVAHLAYPDPAMRMFGDNDLLLSSEQFDDAVELLCLNGYVRQTAPARAGYERRFAKGTTLSGQDGDELDLHRNLVFGTFGFRIDLDELFGSAVPFEIGGRVLGGLGPEARLLHACYHAGLGDPRPRFSSVRDVAQMLTFGTHDPARVLALARAWDSEAVLARAVQLCEDLLGYRPDDEVASAVRGHEPTTRERRAIDSYVGENRRFAAKVVASLPYIDGVGEKAAFVTSVAFPQKGFAESFGGRSGVAWIRRGVRSLLRGGRR